MAEEQDSQDFWADTDKVQVRLKFSIGRSEGLGTGIAADWVFQHNTSSSDEGLATTEEMARSVSWNLEPVEPKVRYLYCTFDLRPT